MIKFKSTEHKLWWMIISQTLFDLQSAVYKQNAPIKIKYSLYDQCRLRDVLHDIHHPWMQEICLNAGLSYPRLLQKVEEIVHGKVKINDFIERRGSLPKGYL